MPQLRGMHTDFTQRVDEAMNMVGGSHLGRVRSIPVGSDGSRQALPNLTDPRKTILSSSWSLVRGVMSQSKQAKVRIGRWWGGVRWGLIK